MKRRFLFTLLCMLCATLGSARDLERGYRGFVEWDNAIGETDYLTQYKGSYGKGTLLFMGISTSHGYQFDSHWFVGGGAMLSCSFPKTDKCFPAFFDVRYDTNIKNFTPYVDFRGGGYFDGHKSGGLYLSPTVGYAMRKSKKLNFNFGIGITLRGFTKKYTRNLDFMVHQKRSETNIYTFFAARIGIDFD